MTAYGRVDDQQVPEPGTLLLSGLTLIGLLVQRRRLFAAKLASANL
jgi:hypothetical protein